MKIHYRTGFAQRLLDQRHRLTSEEVRFRRLHSPRSREHGFHHTVPAVNGGEGNYARRRADHSIIEALVRTSDAPKAKRFHPTHGYQFVGPKAYVVSAGRRWSGTSDFPSFYGADVLSPVSEDTLTSVV